MADESDAQDALAARIGARFYPNGETAGSAIGAEVYIIKGWPLPADLDARLASKTGSAPAVIVSVFPVPNLTRNTTRALPTWEVANVPTATVAVAVDPNAGTVTVTGRGDPCVVQHVGVIVDGAAFPYIIGPTATAADIAAALAALIAPAYPGTVAAGPVLTIPGAARLIARLGVVGTLKAEVEREQIGFMLTVWAPTPALRNAAGRIVRAAMAASPRMPMADGSVANLTYRLTTTADTHEKVAIYRRDIHYWVEIGVFDETDGTQVTQPVTTIQRVDFADVPIGPLVSRIA